MTKKESRLEGGRNKLTSNYIDYSDFVVLPLNITSGELSPRLTGNEILHNAKFQASSLQVSPDFERLYGELNRAGYTVVLWPDGVHVAVKKARHYPVTLIKNSYETARQILDYEWALHNTPSVCFEKEGRA